MSNPFNYTLSDFFDTNIPAVYDQDYYVDYKSLRFQLSSTYYQQLTALTCNNKGLCALDLGNLPNLSSVSIREPSLVQFQSSTNLTYISAENVSVPNLVLSGGTFTYFGIFYSPALQSIDLTNVKSIGNFVMVINNYQLSEINWGNSLNTVPTFLILGSNNLSNETVDTLFSSICAVSGNTDLTGKTITVSNPNSGTNTGYEALTALQDEGASISVSVISPTPTPTPTITPTVSLTPTITPTVSRGAAIGFIIWVANETVSTYGTNNDCAVQIMLISPEGRTFTVASDLGSTTVSSGSVTTINGVRASVWGSGETKTITITDTTNGSSSTTIFVTPGYNTGDVSITATPAGGSPTTYNNIAGSTSFSNPISFYNGQNVTTTPTPSITRTPTPTITPTKIPTETVTPTITPTETVTPTITPTVSRGAAIGFIIWVANETVSTYGTNNDCAVQIMLISPEGRTFTVASDLGSTTVSSGSVTTINGVRASVWGSGETKTITITDTTNGSSSTTIFVTPGYNTGDVSITATPAGGSPTTYNNIAGSTSFSNPISFYNGQNVTTTPTPSITRTPTPTITPTKIPTETVTPTITPTETVTPTVTQTITPTPGASPSVTPTRTPTITPTQTPTVTPTSTSTSTAYTIWDESINGSLSNNENIPTQITLNNGNGQVIASVTSGVQNADYFTFSVGSNQILNKIFLRNYSSSDNVAWLGIKSGSDWTIGYDQSQMLAQQHFGPGNVNQEILGGAAPYNPGNYTVRVQQLGSNTNYTLEFQVIAAPTPTPTPTNTPTITPTITPEGTPFLDMTIWVANETISTYGTNDDCAVQIRPNSPPLKTFTISSDLGSSSVATNSTATFNNSRSSVWGSGTAKTFTITATDNSVGATLLITPGYNTANTSVTVTLTGGTPTLSSYAGVTTFTKPVEFVNGAFA